MTVEEFLNKVDVDVSTNKSVLANQLKADLSLENYFIDFSKNVDNLTDDDKYQIGRSLIPYHIKGIPFFVDNFIELMNNSIEYTKVSDNKIKEKIIRNMQSYIDKLKYDI